MKKSKENKVDIKNEQEDQPVLDNDKLKQALHEAQKEQALLLMNKLPVAGSVLWLYMHSKVHRHVFLGDLEWMLIPPMIVDQCKLYMKDKVPYGFITWAFLGKDQGERLITAKGRIGPGEWNSGDELWLIDMVAPFGGIEGMLSDIRNTMFPDRIINLLIPSEEGNGFKVKTWSPVKDDDKNTDIDKETEPSIH